MVTIIIPRGTCEFLFILKKKKKKSFKVSGGLCETEDLLSIKFPLCAFSQL